MKMMVMMKGLAIKRHESGACAANKRILYRKGYAVRLLTHVLCKPTHFIFHSFIATISYSLQTSFRTVIKDWTDKYHAWGIPLFFNN